jgi:zinc protease
MVVAFAGNVDWDEALDAISGAFGDWRPEVPASVLDLPDVPRPIGITRRDLVLAGKSQSALVIGRPALSRRSPDYYALTFADLILGGLGLMGRLGEKVRDEQGLAYHVSSSLESTLGPGAWQVNAGVAPDHVDRAIAAILEQIRRIRTEPITDAELADGKSYVTGVLPLALETNSGVARLIEVYELGLDYVERYARIIQSLTREQVLAAAERYMSESDLVIVVAGSAREGGHP